MCALRLVTAALIAFLPVVVWVPVCRYVCHELRNPLHVLKLAVVELVGSFRGALSEAPDSAHGSTSGTRRH